MGVSESETSAAAWWDRQRIRYNIGLVLAGVAAFSLYAAVIEMRSEMCPGFEIAAFTILLQGVGYLVVIGVANVFYNLGRRHGSSHATSPAFVDGPFVSASPCPRRRPSVFLCWDISCVLRCREPRNPGMTPPIRERITALRRP